jgi:hypothetical protein
MEAELDEHKPTRVLCAAGLTGRPNVDWCETNKVRCVCVCVCMYEVIGARDQQGQMCMCVCVCVDGCETNKVRRRFKLIASGTQGRACPRVGSG